MNYVLKRKDEIITIIDFADDGSVSKFHQKLVNPELAPLHDVNNYDWLKQWWKRRSIPISQGNIRQMLERKGLRGRPVSASMVSRFAAKSLYCTAFSRSAFISASKAGSSKPR